MGITYLSKQKAYRVSFGKRHPITKRMKNLSRVQFTDRNGIKHPIKTKTKAESLLRELIIEIDNFHKRESVPTWEKLLSEFEVYYLDTGVQLKTVETYSLCLSKHTKHWFDLGCEEISEIMIRELIGSLESKSVSHRKNILKFIRRVFQFAIGKRYVTHNPTPEMKFKFPNKNANVLKEAEITTLLNLAKARDSPWYAHWSLALYTGMRNGELYALRWGAVDLDTNLIRVVEAWNSKDGFKSTKSGNERLIPIAPQLRPLLKKALLKNEHDEFVLSRLPKWKKGEQARELRKFLVGCGLPSIRFHDLRASWATLLLSKGVEPVKVMAMGGWEDMKTMMIYIRKAGLDLNGSTDCLEFHDSVQEFGQLVKLVNT